MQKEELKAYCKSRGWDDLYFYEDIASATNSKRSGLKELRSDAGGRKIDVILIWKLDRLFRSLKDLVVTLTELEEIGVVLVSLRDQIDMTTSSGRLMVHLLGAFAQFEADLIRSRVKAGIEKAKRDGKTLGRPRLNKEQEIKTLRDKGYSYGQIQMKLKVSKGAVWRALKNYPKNPSKSRSLSNQNQRVKNEN